MTRELVRVDVSPERIRIVDSVFHRHGVKADTVGRVENITAQTQVEPFGHGEALRQTCVQGKVSVTTQRGPGTGLGSISVPKRRQNGCRISKPMGTADVGRRSAWDSRLERGKSADIPVGRPIISVADADREAARPAKQPVQLPATDDRVQRAIPGRHEPVVSSQLPFLNPLYFELFPGALIRHTPPPTP